MALPHHGLHETLITEALLAELGRLPNSLVAEPRALELGEAADRLAVHVGLVLRRALDGLSDEDRVERGVQLARRLVEEIGAVLEDVSPGERPVEPGQILSAVFKRLPTGAPATLRAPLIPLLDTTLLTNAPGEPRVGLQIEAELDSADRVDVVMAFIRRSGLRPLLPGLKRAVREGRPVRVLTTTYTGSTEGAALDELVDLGAKVRVSYDSSTTRLHAKAWLFHRDSGWSTAYIGSSNLTHSAQVTGLEWNVRLSAARNPDVLRKVSAVFDAYWNGRDFEEYDAEEFLSRVDTRPASATRLSAIELRPEPFQERLLEQIALARQQGHHRNLLVSATGTGKTVMAALDYARLRQAEPRSRLLFVAHRREILEQSTDTFRHALREPAFGELWLSGERPRAFEHVFASIQTLSRAQLELLAPDHFDVVIVDEFHHAAAPSYERLLRHVRPRELLGLTATPERSDGLSILEHFDGRIAAELRLWDAIDQQRLVPFLYFGVNAELDLRDIPWKRGRGYDVDALSGVLTGDERIARTVLSELSKHVDHLERIRCLGFCVSVEHARFMARVFESAGVRALAVWGDSSDVERESALRALAAGEIQVLFSVDLFNEGVDLPAVDTLLLLRPTDSPTLFLQQLGRGLRRHPGKSACTVLDFVGHHRKEFRVDRRYRALLGGARDELVRSIEAGFPFLPVGCHMELDAVARESVLRNIRESIPTLWRQKAEELAAMARTDEAVKLGTFLERSGLELADVYGRGWTALRESAGLSVLAAGPHETALRRALSRLLHVDDPERIDGYRTWLASDRPPQAAHWSPRERRLLRMLVASLLDSIAGTNEDFDTGLRLVWEHPAVRAEFVELLDVLAGGAEHCTPAISSLPDAPLRLHARYTRVEILAALGVRSERAVVPSWQSGVQWIEESNCDAFAFTLDKSDGRFSPTTRYRDYAISPELIHWESQSVTRADSETGRRYRNHVALGTQVLLFTRHRVSDRAFYFLGPAQYVSHRSERPMEVVWKLEHPLPGDLFASFAAAVA